MWHASPLTSLLRIVASQPCSLLAWGLHFPGAARPRGCHQSRGKTPSSKASCDYTNNPRIWHLAVVLYRSPALSSGSKNAVCLPGQPRVPAALVEPPAMRRWGTGRASNRLLCSGTKKPGFACHEGFRSDKRGIKFRVVPKSPGWLGRSQLAAHPALWLGGDAGWGRGGPEVCC